MSSCSNEFSKRRRMDDGGTDRGVESEPDVHKGSDRDDGSSHQQLLSAMNILIDQNQTMQRELANMRQNMEGIKEEMKTMNSKCEMMGDLLQKSQAEHNTRFDGIENRQKYQQILLKNQQWEYPSLSSGNDEGSRDFISHIKTLTCDMRYGRCRGRIDVSAPVDSQSQYHYHRLFDRHWSEFISALGEYEYGLRCLPEGEPSDPCSTLRFVGRFQLPFYIVTQLLSALETTHFKRLALVNNDFGNGDGFNFALDYMKNNPKMESLHLDRTEFKRTENVERFCQLIKEHPSIITLVLNQCCGDEIGGYDVLCSLLRAGRDKLEDIVFIRNNISTEGDAFIPDFLATNPKLKCLTLAGNNLVDNDATSIAEALKGNTNLQYLDLHENPIAERGWVALEKTEFDSSSLNSVSDSNHTCLVEGASKFNNDEFGEQAVRQKKIYTLLCSRNEKGINSQHFDSIDIELLPNMLESIQRYDKYNIGENGEADENLPFKDEDEVNAFSIVYEILRTWDKVLSVYEFLSNNAQKRCNDHDKQA